MILAFLLLMFVSEISCKCGCNLHNKTQLFKAIDEYKTKWAESDEDHRPMWGGDMIIEPEQLEYFYNPNQVTGFAAIKQKYRWTNNTLHYYINESITDNGKYKYRQLIIDSLADLEKQIGHCVRFIQHNSTANLKHFVHVRSDVKNGGCSSYVGQRLRSQTLSLKIPGCFTKGIIQHEFIHALGFQHEHCRPDRDEHIFIDEKLIDSSKCYAFDKCKGCETFGLPYDYNSIMHYSPKSFGCSRATVIFPIDESKTIKRYGISELDVKKIRAYYDCK